MDIIDLFGGAARSRFAFRVAGEPDVFSVLAFSGEDHALSCDYRFSVELLAPAPVDPASLLGKAALLQLSPGAGPVHGVVASFAALGPCPDGHLHAAELASPLHPLHLSRSNRVFLARSAPQILEELARGIGLPVRLVLRESYPHREFTVQFGESDLDFFRRLAAFWGIFFRFEAGEDGLVLVLHDSLDDLPRHPLPLPYAPESGAVRPEGTLFSLRPRSRLLPAEAEVRDYNYRTPETPLQAASSPGAEVPAAGKLSRFGENAKDLEEASRLARLRRQALDGGREIFLAETDLPLAPGLRLAVAGHPEFGGDYLLLALSHRGDQRAGFAYGAENKAPTYRALLHMIPAGTPWRPVLPEKRLHGVFSARVESPGGDTAHLDEQGRYRVRLHFDAGEAPAAGATHPIRMMQPYGGSDYGLHLPLQAGAEVLLACVGGDPDRPVLLGALPNPASPSPVTAANATQNILRTAGGNELLLEDRKGQEKIELFTRDRENLLALVAASPGHGALLASAQGKMELSAATTALLSSTQTHTLQSGADHLVSVEGSQRLSTEEGEIACQAAADLRLKAGRNVTFQSEEEDITLHAGENLILDAGEEMSVEVRSGDLKLLLQSGSLTLQASGAVTILGEGGGSIRIGQGEGFIEIDPEGNITIEAPEVEIVGETVALQGAQNFQGGGGGGGGQGESLSAVALQDIAEFHNPLQELYKAGPNAAPLENPRQAALEAKKMRLAERNSLIQKGRAKAATLPSPRKEKLQSAADRLHLNNRGVEHARLSDDAYNDPGTKDPPVAWKRISNNPKDLPPALQNAVWEDENSGFRAALYESEIDGSKIIAFRGTANKAGWINNFAQAFGYESEQYDYAMRLAARVKSVYGDKITFTGHSLGGGLTSASCGATNTYGYIFNASGLHPNTVASYGITRADVSSLIESYKVAGDALSVLQNSAVNFVAAPLGTAVRYIRQANPVSLYNAIAGNGTLNLQPVWIYDAIGKTHDLPSVDIDGNSSHIFDSGPLDRHSMEHIINGIEKQKRDDINEIKTSLE